MPTIADSLNVETILAMKAVATAPDKVTIKAKDKVEFVVIKASTEPNPPRTLTGDDVLEFEPGEEGLLETLCVDCRQPMTIDTRDFEPDAEVFAICDKDKQLRERHKAIKARRNVETIRKPSVAKHQPRTTDGQDHPVVTTTKENAMTDETPTPVDLDQIPEAEIGRMVLKQARLAKEKVIVVEQAKAKKAKKRKEAKVQEGIAADQERRKGHVLPGFMVGTTLEIPTLDLSDVTDLSLEPNATERSPYNKARFRMFGEQPMWSPRQSNDEGYVPTTYAMLEAEHKRLAAASEEYNLAKAAEQAEHKRLSTAKKADKAPKKKKAKATKAPKASKAQPVLAVTEPETPAKVVDPAKVAAMVKITGLTEAQVLAVYGA